MDLFVAREVVDIVPNLKIAEAQKPVVFHPFPFEFIGLLSSLFVEGISNFP